MKKTISGVLLALTAVFALVACGKKKDKTTKGTDTTKGGTQTTTAAGTTTKAIPAGNGRTISFYCWNDEFQSRLRKYYKEGDKKVENITSTIDLLPDGTKIKWTLVANEGSQYQDALDEALKASTVDMFCFEADYAKKYVTGAMSAYVTDMETLGVNQDKQYQYTVDAVTNAADEKLGSSWQACPGAIAYNNNVMEAVFGETTLAEAGAKLNTQEAFWDTAADLEYEHTKYAMMIGPADWYRAYGNMISGPMYDATEKTITVDENIFNYAVDTKEFNEAGYLLGDSAAYGLWGASWNASMNADSNALTMFVCPWFTDFCMAGNCPAEKDKDGNVIPESQPWRVVKGYADWFWGGTWLTATKSGIADADKKTTISNIIKTMTTDTTTLRAISDGELDFTNDEDAMNAKAEDTTVKNDFFGGQNVYAIYAVSVQNASLANASDYDQQITENFQSAFLPYIQGAKKGGAAKDCWKTFVDAIAKVNKDLTVSAASSVDVSGDEIVIA
ncbi:MAG: hypothetical protein J6Y28_05755 [Acholeplasmatales bacterium]|nr:hypothetical protein [Acholeplasmatales bacterium]